MNENLYIAHKKLPHKICRTPPAFASAVLLFCFCVLFFAVFVCSVVVVVFSVFVKRKRKKLNKTVKRIGFSLSLSLFLSV